MGLQSAAWKALDRELSSSSSNRSEDAKLPRAMPRSSTHKGKFRTCKILILVDTLTAAEGPLCVNSGGSMPRAWMFRCVALPFLLSLLSLFLLVRCASADGVTFTVTTPTSVTVAEGDNSETIDLTLSNDSGSTIFPVFGVTSGIRFVSGDMSDLGAPGFPYSTTCRVSLSSGSSCTFSFPLVTGTDTGETDADFGVTEASFTAFYEYENCAGCTYFSVDA